MGSPRHHPATRQSRQAQHHNRPQAPGQLRRRTPAPGFSRGCDHPPGTVALKEQLGSGYKVTPHGTGSLTVKHGGLAFATVRMHWAGDTTAFRVHGSGLIINPVVNEFGLARKVTGALEEGLTPKG